MSLGNFRRRPIRRRWVIGFTLTAILAAVALFVASASGVPGSPSDFESNDGNMIVDTMGQNDWASVAFDHVSDPAHTGTDNSFVPGQKQDTTCPDVTGHQNPPKDDFTDVASYTETASGGTYDGDTFLYGATIRYAPNGNASENVELKKSSELCPGQPVGGVTVRTADDKLIAIDYLNGGTDVQFHVLTWITDNNTEACYVGNHTAPCWGADVQTLSQNAADGAASQSDISAADNPISGVDIAAGEFAEFGINLAAAGIVPSGSCEAFAQTLWESRASGSSFVSTTKDITIENKTTTNCGEVIIHKHTNPRGDDVDFGFTSDLSGTQLSCTQSTAAAFSLNDSGNTNSDNAANTQDCTNVPANSYTVTEDDPNSLNYKLDSISCTAGANSSWTPYVASRYVDITVAAGETVECTFTNVPLQGALVILKESTKTGNPLVSNDGAEFCYSTSMGCTTTDVIDNGTGDEDNTTTGSVCVEGLTPGTYYVNETAPPDGYGDASQTNQSVTVADGTNCTDNLPGSGATATFTNPPLADIQVNFRDGGSGETSATIDCSMTADSTTPPTGWDTSKEFDDLSPGTYNCTVVIDP